MSWTGAAALNVLPQVDSIYTSAVNVTVNPTNVQVGFTDLTGGNQWSGGAGNYSTVGAGGWTVSVPNADNQRAFLNGPGGVVNLNAGLAGDLTLSSLIINPSSGSYTLDSDAGKNYLAVFHRSKGAYHLDYGQSSDQRPRSDEQRRADQRVRHHDAAGNQTIWQGVTYTQPSDLPIMPTNVLTISGVVSGTHDLTVSGGGTVALTNTANTYDGVTTIMADSCLQVANLSDGAASSLGKSYADSAHLMINGILQYTGTADVITTREFTFYAAIPTYNYPFLMTNGNLTISGPINVAGYSTEVHIQAAPGKTVTFTNPGYNNISRGDFRVQSGTVVFNGGDSSTYMAQSDSATKYSYFTIGDGTAMQAEVDVLSGTVESAGRITVGESNSTASSITPLSPTLKLYNNAIMKGTTYFAMGWNAENAYRPERQSGSGDAQQFADHHAIPGLLRRWDRARYREHVRQLLFRRPTVFSDRQ